MAFCGLDFGTSNSTLGVVRGGRAVLAPLEDSRLTLPSSLFFDHDLRHVLFGREALSSYIEGADGRLMRALKSVLGTSLMQEKTSVFGRAMPFMDVLGLFLAEVKRRGEAFAGEELCSVVMGRPVHFVDDDAAADRAAQDALEAVAKRVGFRHVLFQYEPLAAAMDYEQSVASEQLALIVDIGGGTSDFSVVRLSPERRAVADRSADILASGGVHVGGTDFDKWLSLAAVMPHLGYGSETIIPGLPVPSAPYFDLATWARIHLLYSKEAWAGLEKMRREAVRKELLTRLMHVVDNRTGHTLALVAEKAKEGLSSEASAVLDLACAEKGLTGCASLEDFEAAVAGGVEAMVRSASDTLQQAGVRADQVQAVFLTGGSTAVPLVRSRLLGLVPAATVVEGDMFGSVGLGLAVEAGRRFG